MKHYIEQRSRDWFELRLGKVTSTRLRTVAKGTLAAQSKLLDEIQYEIEHPDEALAKNIDGFGFATPSAIRLGREREDWLVARYEIQRQKDWGRRVEIDRPGFIVHDAIPEFGASLDWLLPDRVGEGKTRVDHTKHEYALKHGMLKEDESQVYAHAMCAGLELADYVSYCPDYEDEAARLAIVEVKLDRAYMNHLYAELNRFLKHLRAGTRPTLPKRNNLVPSFYD